MAYIKGLTEQDLGMPTANRAVTATLYVSPNGDNTNGSTWAKAYTTIQGALAVAATDANDCTLILIAPNTGANYYDIATDGDPTWTGNYILKGSHRNWVKIKNTNAGATSIMKFTGYVGLQDLNINLGVGALGVNGVIFTTGGARVDDCMFIGEDLTVAATAIHLDGATAVKNCKIRNSDIKGEATKAHMTGILLDNANCAELKDLRIGFCASGIQQVGANSALNKLDNIEFCTNVIAINADVGSGMLFESINFSNNTTNIDDEIGGHIFSDIQGEFEISVEPENLTGVDVESGAGAWGTDTELRAVATSTKPFKVISYRVQPDTEANTLIRFSADSGTTFFTESVFASKKNKASGSGDATDFIFNAGTRISCSVWGEDTHVWLGIQEI